MPTAAWLALRNPPLVSRLDICVALLYPAQMGGVSKIYFSKATSLRQVYGAPLPPSEPSSFGRRPAPPIKASRAPTQPPTAKSSKAKKAALKKKQKGAAFTEHTAVERVREHWVDWVPIWLHHKETRISKFAQTDGLALFSPSAKQVAVLVADGWNEVTLSDAADLLRLQIGLKGGGLRWSVALVCEDKSCLALPASSDRRVDRRLALLRKIGMDDGKIALTLAREFPTPLDDGVFEDLIAVPAESAASSEERADATVSSDIAKTVLSEEASIEWLVAQGSDMLKRGKFLQAVKLCKRHGQHPRILGHGLERWIDEKYHQGSYGELLAFLGEAGECGAHTAVELLLLAAQKGDEMALLKHAQTLGMYEPLRREVDRAIEGRAAKGLADAEAWRRKFQDGHVS